MKTIVSVTTGLLSILFTVACQSFSDQNGAMPANATCQPLNIKQNIIGTWSFVSSFTGSHQSRYTGTISFNSDGTVTDPDSLLPSGSFRIPVEKKLYTLHGDTLRFITITKTDTTAFGGVAEAKDCDKITFGSWFYLTAASKDIKLLLIRL